jgi:hypothetical protein
LVLGAEGKPVGGGDAPPAGQPSGTVVMAGMQVEPADRAWARVEVLVVTPEREVSAVGFKLMGHGADTVGKIPADENTAFAGGGGDGGEVEELATHVKHTR